MKRPETDNNNNPGNEYIMKNNRFKLSALALLCLPAALLTTQTNAATDIKLDEATARIALDDQTEHESRLAVLAMGRGAELLNRVGLAADRSHRPIWSARVTAPHPKKGAAGEWKQPRPAPGRPAGGAKGSHDCESASGPNGCRLTSTCRRRPPG